MLSMLLMRSTPGFWMLKIARGDVPHDVMD